MLGPLTQMPGRDYLPALSVLKGRICKANASSVHYAVWTAVTKHISKQSEEQKRCALKFNGGDEAMAMTTNLCSEQFTSRTPVASSLLTVVSSDPLIPCCKRKGGLSVVLCFKLTCMGCQNWVDVSAILVSNLFFGVVLLFVSSLRLSSSQKQSEMKSKLKFFCFSRGREWRMRFSWQRALHFQLVAMFRWWKRTCESLGWNSRLIMQVQLSKKSCFSWWIFKLILLWTNIADGPGKV